MKYLYVVTVSAKFGNDVVSSATLVIAEDEESAENYALSEALRAFPVGKGFYSLKSKSNGQLDADALRSLLKRLES